MNNKLQRKAYLGLGTLFIPLPGFLLSLSINQSTGLICKQTAELSGLERQVHRYVVSKLTETNQPVSLSTIVEDLKVPRDTVQEIVDKLEELKVYFYRYDNPDINWAYPVTSEPRDYRLSFDTGESCTAA